MCKALACCLKFLLGVIAIIMMIVGIVLTVGGGILLWGMKPILKSLIPVLPQLTDLLKEIGVKVDAQIILDLLSNNSSSVGAVAFAIGLALLIVSLIIMIAMCCCSTKILFIVITVVLSLITLGLVVLLAYIASDPTQKVLVPLEKYLQETLIEKYTEIKGTDPESVLINIMHIRLQCCGLSGYKNFDTDKMFKRTGVTIEGIPYSDIKFPISCCNYDINFKIHPTELTNCLMVDKSDRKNKGCWTQLTTTLLAYLKYVFIALGVTIAVLVLVILVLICFICCMDKF